MTTILGIKTNSGEEGIVIAADTRITLYDDDDEISAKERASKIRIGENYAVAFAGGVDSYLECLMNYISKKKNFQEFTKFVSNGELKNLPKKINQEPINEAIKTKYFESLNILNRYTSKRNSGDLDDTVDFILSVNEPSLELYHVDAFGNLLESKKPSGLEYVCCGSGAKTIKDYFLEEEYKKDPYLNSIEFSMDNVDISTAIRLATKTMKKASKDLETGDMIDFVVLKNDKIENHESKASKRLENLYDQIAKRYEEY